MPSVGKEPGTDAHARRRAVAGEAPVALDRDAWTSRAAGQHAAVGDGDAFDHGHRLQPLQHVTHDALGIGLRVARSPAGRSRPSPDCSLSKPRLPCRRASVCTNKPDPINRTNVKASWPATSSLRSRTPPPAATRDRSVSDATSGVRPRLQRRRETANTAVMMLARNANASTLRVDSQARRRRSAEEDSTITRDTPGAPAGRARRRRARSAGSRSAAGRQCGRARRRSPCAW